MLLAKLLFPALVTIFCVAFLVNLSGMPAEAATYPRLAIAVTLLLVLSSTIAECRASRDGHSYPAMDAPQTRHRSRRSVYTILLLALFVYSMPRIGFYPAAAIYLSALCALMGLRDPVRLVALIGGILLAGYLLFTVILQVLLPRGPFQFG
jgi:hypothetical protein